MPNAARLSNAGEMFAFEFDDHTNTSFSVSSTSTVFASEFDENTATTLSGNQRMRATSTGGVIVLDSINEIDTFDDIDETNLELHLDSVDSNVYLDPTPSDQQLFTSSGTFTVPLGVTQVSAVVVGGGGGGGNATNDDEPGAGGGGGGLAYGTWTVESGQQYTITVGGGGNNGEQGETGGTSSITRDGTTYLSATGGGGGSSTDGDSEGGGAGGTSGGTERDGGGSGGQGGATSDSTTGAGGGGGAAGYSGNGGAGSDRGTTNATAGSGGGGGGGGSGSTTQAGGGGGGVGVAPSALTNGSAGTGGTGGGGGSGGSDGGSTVTSVGAGGGLYGGGGGGGRSDEGGGDGQPGAVRIIWGPNRFYPSSNVPDVTPTLSNAYWEDISGNNRDVRLVNNPDINYFDFDSTISEYGIADGSATGTSAYTGVTGTNARTILIAFKPDSTGVGYKVFSYGTNTPGTRFTFNVTTANRFQVLFGNGRTETAINTVTTGWNLFAVVVPTATNPSINSVRIWYNGIEQTLSTFTGTNTINTSSATNVEIGGAPHETTDPAYFDGEIIKVMMYSRVLVDLEIKQIYQSMLTKFT